MALDNNPLRSRALCSFRASIATTIAMIISSAALAQPVQSQDPNLGDTGRGSGAIDRDRGPSDQGEIVITGSRISRQDYSSHTPVVTVGQEAISSTGSPTIETALSRLPQFSAGYGSQTGFPNNRGGQAQVNLRGLGTNRALVLLDGRRIQASNADGTVDINIIPAALIDNVETITGGASSTYGSDAMSGVVNFKLQRRFEGLRFDAQSSITSRGDGATKSASATVGANFAGDRGNITLFGSLTARDEIVRAARDFFRLSQVTNRLPTALFNFSNSPPTQAALDAAFGQYGAAAGSVPRSSQIGINNDGSLYASPGIAPVVNYRGPINETFLIFDNVVSFNAGRTTSLQVPLDRYNGFARAVYDATDNIELFVQGLYTHSSSSTTASPITLGSGGQNGIIPVTNPFIPANVRSLLQSRANPNASATFTYLFDQLGPFDLKTTYDVYQVVGGGSGKLFGNWKWDVSASAGQTKSVFLVNNILSYRSILNLLSAPDGGNSQCAGGFNPFIPQGLSPACLAFVARESRTESYFRQAGFEANFQGSILALPAGDLKAAVGAAYRRDYYSIRPSAVAASGELSGSFATILPAEGRQNVKELYGELFVPLVRDVPFIQALNLNLGYRYSDYNTVGGISTYKADAEWEIAKFARVRGGFSRAIRAPSLGELNAPAAQISTTIGTASSSSTAGDPCDIRSSFRLGTNAANVRSLCLAQGVPLSIIDQYVAPSVQVSTITSGNRNLEEETATTYSLGLVLSSPFEANLIRKVRASVDYYDIEISGAIGTLPFVTGLARCFNADGISNSNYSASNENCTVVSRNAVGAINGGANALLNLGLYRTRGIDGQIDWSIPFGGNGGEIVTNVVASYLLSFKVQTLPGAAPLDYSGYATGGVTDNSLPKFKLQANVGYASEPFGISLRWRHLSALKDVSRLTSSSSTIPGVAPYDYFDLVARVSVGKSFDLRFIVNNLTDKGPPQIGVTPGITDFATYDLVGRLYTLSVTARF